MARRARKLRTPVFARAREENRRYSAVITAGTRKGTHGRTARVPSQDPCPCLRGENERTICISSATFRSKVCVDLEVVLFIKGKVCQILRLVLRTQPRVEIVPIAELVGLRSARVAVSTPKAR